jgi:hypothetical protein
MKLACGRADLRFMRAVGALSGERARFLVRNDLQTVDYRVASAWSCVPRIRSVNFVLEPVGSYTSLVVSARNENQI